jgi:hypothetical protein
MERPAAWNKGLLAANPPHFHHRLWGVRLIWGDGMATPRTPARRSIALWPRRRRWQIALALLASLALGWVSGILPRAWEAGQLLRHLAGDGLPTGVQRLPLTLAGQAGSHAADLYALAQAGHLPGLVLLPGASPDGKDEPRLVAFAQQLAAAGFRVLVPDSASLRQLRVDARDALLAADAVALLAGDSGQVGIAAISYATGPAVLAALRPDTRERVGFIVAIGGYHDGTALVTYVTTGHYRAPGETAWRHREPNAYGKWVFVLSNAARLQDRRDAALLGGIALRKLGDLGAGIGDLVVQLGPEGRSVYALVDNRDPEAVPGLLAGLPPPVLRELQALDLARQDLSRLKARLILIHGQDDPIVPFTESLGLAAAAPAGGVELHLLGSLAHVELSVASLRDGWQLFQAAWDLLAARDALPALPAPVAPQPSREPGSTAPVANAT